MTLAELGARLRGSGLTPRALAAWAGTTHVPALAARREELAAREPVPAAIALSLFVAGRDIAIDRARALLPVDALLEADLAVEDVQRDAHEDRGRCLRAAVSILPIGPSLVVCDRLDAPPTAERVCWPDDSSYHLASSIPPGRVDAWTDLGCGSAFAPLVHPEHASSIVGVDLNPEAVHLARLGAALSGVAHLTIEHGDLAMELPPVQLVTCNAPMPASRDSGLEMWRSTDDDLFERLWRVLPDRVARGGVAVVHAAVSAIPYERLAGERVLVTYTPVEIAPAFGVLWWRPDAPDCLVTAHRALTPQRPHLDARDSVLAGDA